MVVSKYLWFCHAWVLAKSLQYCLALCKPTDHSPPGSSVHRILQARILEWVTIPSSRGSPQPPGIRPKSLMSPGWMLNLYSKDKTSRSSQRTVLTHIHQQASQVSYAESHFLPLLLPFAKFCLHRNKELKLLRVSLGCQPPSHFKTILTV